MKVTVLVAILALSGAVACSRRDAPKESGATALAPIGASAQGAGGAPVATSVSASAVGGSSTPDRVPLPPRSLSATARDSKPPVASEIDFPVVRRRAANGSLVVWSEEEGEGSRLLAGIETKPGELVGGSAAKVLRRTSGKIRAIDLVDDVGLDKDIVVAWASDLGEGKGQLVALVSASTDLARVTAPTTLGLVAANVALAAHVAIIRSPRGGVVVAHQGPGVRCRLGPEDTECVTYEVKAVSASGRVERIGHGKLHGGPSPELRLLDIDGRALLVYASSMRGGRTLAAEVVPWTTAEVAPSIAAPTCDGLAAFMPEVERGAAGEIVALCTDVPLEKGPCARPLRGDKERCLRVAITGADGRPSTPKDKDAVVLRVECAGSAARLVFAGGAVVLAGPSPMAADFAPGCGAQRPGATIR